MFPKIFFISTEPKVKVVLPFLASQLRSINLVCLGGIRPAVCVPMIEKKWPFRSVG
jgi:hypothetical protein